MIFGKYINLYYRKHFLLLLMGLLSLVAVDYLQLIIPNLYQMVINGLDMGYVLVDGVERAFDMEFVLSTICMPMVVVILCIVLGRFLWRVCFFTAAIKVEGSLRSRMFDHSERLSQEYYQ
ncbi:MAG: hypothetical protein KBS81_11275, partial [Spirochaetales bacterium]|nr:hypothetical protein [Candidatus Physcosoma equi]